MISQKAKYALKAIVALAKADPAQVVIIGELAERENIPKKFLEQILLDLKHHGIVTSRRGKAGGYSLLKAPSEITFGEVLRIVDGPLAPLPCLSRMAYRRCEDCAEEQSCEVRKAFAAVAEASRRILDAMSIEKSLDAGEEKIGSLRAG
jgi:Rrf2 family protein